MLTALPPTYQVKHCPPLIFGKNSPRFQDAAAKILRPVNEMNSSMHDNK